MIKILLSLCYFSITILYLGCYREVPAPDYYPTLYFLTDLSLITTEIVYESKEPMPTEIKELVKWLDIKCREKKKVSLCTYIIEGKGYNKDNNSQFKIDAENGVIYDGWGRPIRLIKLNNGDYKYISYGANGTDDMGKWDDLGIVIHIIRSLNSGRRGN